MCPFSFISRCGHKNRSQEDDKDELGRNLNRENFIVYGDTVFIAVDTFGDFTVISARKNL